MKCPSCNFIFFRPAKKCPSCGGGLSRATFSEQPDEEFSIYAAAAGGGLGLDDGDSFGSDAGLETTLYSGTDTLDQPDSADDFDLDLSDTGEDNDSMSDAALETEPAVPVEDTLDFDLGSGEFSDVDVDGMGIDLEIPEETTDLNLDLGGDTTEIDLDLDLGGDIAEPELDLDLGGDDVEAAPEINLDLDTTEPEIDLDLGEDTGPELDLDLDLDLGGNDDPLATPDFSTEDSASTDEGLDLDLDGLELDLDLGTDDDK